MLFFARFSDRARTLGRLELDTSRHWLWAGRGRARGGRRGGGCTLDWVGLGYSAGRAGGRAGGGRVAVGESSPGFRFLGGGEWGEAAVEMD